MQIPWKIKSACFSAIDLTDQRLLYFAQKRLTRRSRVAVTKVADNWKFHERNIASSGGEKVIEFGAGKYLAQNLYLSSRGVRQTIVDLFPMLDLSLVNKSINDLSLLDIQMNGQVNNLDDLMQKFKIEYLAPFDMRNTGFPDGSYDSCISTATLEHIPIDSIKEIWKETYRILKHGGVVSACIDYRDHYAITDKSIPILNFLKYTDEEWKKYNHKSHFQNRLRHKHHCDLLTEAGFEIVEDWVVSAANPNEVIAAPGLLTGEQSDFGKTGRILAKKV